MKIGTDILVHPETKKSFRNIEDLLKEFNVINGILPNLIWPVNLPDEDKHSKDFYEGRARQYEDTLHLTFFTHSLNEAATRSDFVSRLNLHTKSKVLEIACGTGRDSEIIAQKLGSDGELHMQDISEDMIRICMEKLSNVAPKTSFCLSNAHYLPYPDQYFDATYSFGAMGEFSDQKGVLKEMVRVTKIGGKIVFGDESVPTWLRDTEYYKILLATNPLFKEEPPLKYIPVEARDVNLSWVIGSTFYLMDFVRAEGEPSANFDYEIPGFRGGTYRTRYEGQLEGVKPETKRKAYEYVRQNGLNMHTWLDTLINEHIKKG